MEISLICVRRSWRSCSVEQVKIEVHVNVLTVCECTLLEGVSLYFDSSLTTINVETRFLNKVFLN